MLPHIYTNIAMMAFDDDRMFLAGIECLTLKYAYMVILLSGVL
jgi:hypothetical protein